MEEHLLEVPDGLLEAHGWRLRPHNALPQICRRLYALPSARQRPRNLARSKEGAHELGGLAAVVEGHNAVDSTQLDVATALENALVEGLGSAGQG